MQIEHSRKFRLSTGLLQIPILLLFGWGVCPSDTEASLNLEGTVFEQAGRQKQLSQAGLWYATAPEEDLIELMRQEPGLMRDWDKKYGDRMEKIVFIGQHLDKERLTRDLDACLADEG